MSVPHLQVPSPQVPQVLPSSMPVPGDQKAGLQALHFEVITGLYLYSGDAYEFSEIGEQKKAGGSAQEDDRVDVGGFEFQNYSLASRRHDVVRFKNTFMGKRIQSVSYVTKDPRARLLSPASNLNNLKNMYRELAESTAEHKAHIDQVHNQVVIGIDEAFFPLFKGKEISLQALKASDAYKALNAQLSERAQGLVTIKAEYDASILARDLKKKEDLKACDARISAAEVELGIMGSVCECLRGERMSPLPRAFIGAYMDKMRLLSDPPVGLPIALMQNGSLDIFFELTHNHALFKKEEAQGKVDKLRQDKVMVQLQYESDCKDLQIAYLKALGDWQETHPVDKDEGFLQSFTEPKGESFFTTEPYTKIIENMFDFRDENKLGITMVLEDGERVKFDLIFRFHGPYFVAE